MSNTGVKDKVSQTASYTCFCRACASVERDERFRGPDDISRRFVPFLPTVLFLKCGPLRSLVMKKVAPRGIYEYVTARTKLFDEVFGSAIDEGIPQIVILGAGFDTRAWRFERHNSSTRVFELDAPVTQQMKRKLLDKKGVTVPGHIVFTPVDFEAEDIGEALGRAGYRQDMRSLFLLEGLTMYLNWKSVNNTLAFIRGNAPAGSRVVFDYVRASVLRRECKLYGEASVRKMVFKGGEKWVFGIEEGAIGKFLSRRGFELTAHYTPCDLQKIYLTAEDGTMYGRINETHCIALAVVAGENIKED
jgi:methyltransferase (TIGR00027 family)